MFVCVDVFFNPVLFTVEPQHSHLTLTPIPRIAGAYPHFPMQRLPKVIISSVFVELLGHT